jgi:transcription initiation factor TFIIF subunit alpha
MIRDTSTLPVYRTDWEQQQQQQAKAGEGSEFNKEARELHRRRKMGFMPRKTVSMDDLPWILTCKGNEKEKTKDRQFIGKKSVTENSSFFVFIKCADGGFEAHPLEDWYSFAPYKTYRTLDEEEAEEQFKIRHKTLNKLMIMANKRKNEVEGKGESVDDEALDKGQSASSSSNDQKKGFSFLDSSLFKSSSSKSKKSSNLSDDDDEDAATAGQPSRSGAGKKRVTNNKIVKKTASKSKKKRGDDGDMDDEDKVHEDSDDGDFEGREMDYSSTGSELEDEEAPEKYEEKYAEKGVDEEEAIKALDKDTEDEEEGEGSDDEDLTEQGKEFKKLMSKNENGDRENKDDEFEDFFKTGKIGKIDGKPI